MAKATLDPFVLEALKKYGLSVDEIKDGIWPLERKNDKGDLYVIAWIAKHRTLEKLQGLAGIEIDPPQVIEHDSAKCVCSLLITGHKNGKTAWSFGEASPLNYKARGKMDLYPYAMAEKRGKDRVILKLLEIHGFVYSEEEADDFKEPQEGSDKRVNLHGEGHPLHDETTFKEFVYKCQEMIDGAKTEDELKAAGESDNFKSAIAYLEKHKATNFVNGVRVYFKERLKELKPKAA